jgi:hypothetical protein
MKKLTLPIIIALFSCISLQAKDLLEQGYRGMVDVGICANWAQPYFSVSTTHGYQVIPSYLFIGLGIDTHGLADLGEKAPLSSFVCLRSDFMKKRVAPYLDFRVGGEFIYYEGLYLSQAFGINVPAKKSNNIIGIDFILGFESYFGFTKESTNKEIDDSAPRPQERGFSIPEFIPMPYFKIGLEW